MNFYWIIAIVMALDIALILFTGRIRLRDHPLIDRDLNAPRYWFFVGGFVVAEAALIYGAWTARA